jgi:hypothetical protein
VRHTKYRKIKDIGFCKGRDQVKKKQNKKKAKKEISGENRKPRCWIDEEAEWAEETYWKNRFHIADDDFRD